MVIILMGVSGCGKTTTGKLLAERLHLPFYDADDFHPEESVDKMKAGLPLNDSDREPWLRVLSEKIRRWNKTDGAVLACSALKESYRQILTSGCRTEVQFVYLKGAKKTIEKRMKARTGHYMPSGLLGSQFEVLEEPSDALEVSIEKCPDEITEEIYNALKKNGNL